MGGRAVGFFAAKNSPSNNPRGSNRRGAAKQRTFGTNAEECKNTRVPRPARLLKTGRGKVRARARGYAEMGRYMRNACMYRRAVYKRKLKVRAYRARGTAIRTQKLPNIFNIS